MRESQVVIVTGAGRGIGRAIAFEFAKAGSKVVLADRNREDLLNTLGEIESSHFRAISVQTDVRNQEDVGKLMSTAIQTFGRVDVLVNNAGVSRFTSLYDLTIEEWEDVIHTNLRSVFLCSREAALYMREQKEGGAIINMASTRAFMSEPNSEAYAASKGGIVALTHALAVSLGPDNIRVNSISPGWIETGDYTGLRSLDHIQHPAGRVGKPEDISRVCLFLSAPENSFITGENIVVDGGMSRKMIYEP